MLAAVTDYLGEGCDVSLASEDWASPITYSHRVERNSLHLNLPPITYEGSIHFPEVGGSVPRKVGRSFFRPAGYVIEGYATGGHIERLRCRFSDERTAATLGDERPWRPEELERGIDLERSPVVPLLTRLADEMRHPGFGHGVLVDAIVSQAIVELARYLRQAHSEGVTGCLSSVQLRRIEERVRCEVQRPPSVAELAEMSAMSERHLLRLFQATTGSSVSGYIRRELVDRSRRLLTEGELPLKQIAYLLGFSGPSSFSLAFRKATGVTPARYRNVGGRRRAGR